MKRIILLAIVATTSVSCKKETKCYNCFEFNSNKVRQICGTKKERDQMIRFHKTNGVTLSCHEQK